MSQESSDHQDTAAGLDEPAPVVLLRRIDNAIGLLEQIALAVFLLVLVGIGVTQAITIKLGTGLGVWSFEVLRYSVFFIAMTGAALSAHTGQLIAMDFVTRMLGHGARARLQVLLRVFTIGICYLLVVGGLQVADSVSASADAAIDPGLGLMALPIGAGLIGVHVGLQLVIDLVYMSRGETPPELHDGVGSGH